MTDISQQRRSEEQQAHLAHYDPLIDLPNRLLLQSRLEHSLNQGARSRQRVAVLFVNKLVCTCRSTILAPAIPFCRPTTLSD